MELVTPLSTYSGIKCKADIDDGASDCSTVDATQTDELCSQLSLSSFESDDVQTLVIFDWDDTLFPTTWLRSEGLLDGSSVAVHDNDMAEQLRTLADAVQRTLRTALQFGKVVIVTNGQQGWVEASCARTLPTLAEMLQEVEIVSARSSYEKYSQDPTEWKCFAFAHQVSILHVRSDQSLNIVSLGDSLHEQRAVMSVCESMENCFAKSLKFAEGPTIEQLIDQHEFVHTCFLDVAEHNGNLDVEIGLTN
jgi:hypothetical protein